MEIKSLSAVSNTNFENFDKLKQTSDVKEETSKFKVEKAEEVQPIKEKDHKEVNFELENAPKKNLGPVSEEDVKSFSYDMETSTFMIIVKDKDGKIQQYPTEDLLKFKQMLKEELKSELVKELGKK